MIKGCYEYQNESEQTIIVTVTIICGYKKIAKRMKFMEISLRNVPDIF